jgi:hypothetical protein
MINSQLNYYKKQDLYSNFTAIPPLNFIIKYLLKIKFDLMRFRISALPIILLTSIQY